MLRNSSRKITISLDSTVLKSTWSQGIGLMGKRYFDEALVFEFRLERTVGIHMMFVFFPIDVIFLDKNQKVIEVKNNLKPFGFYFSKKKCKSFIEVPVGSIKDLKLKLGDKVVWS